MLRNYWLRPLSLELRDHKHAYWGIGFLLCSWYVRNMALVDKVSSIQQFTNPLYIAVSHA